MQLQLVANELHKIMKLRRIENEVRESEAFLRDIMENVSDAIFVKDREARVIMANPAYYRLMGKFPEEVLNKTAADFHPPEIAKKLAEDDKQVMETGKGITLEERIFTSHGWRIFQTVKAPYYAGQGKITGLIGTARDITEHKKAEEALKKAYDNLEKLVKERTAELEKAYNSLKESEKGLAEAQEMAHIGNWEWGLATEEAYWSDEMYRIFRRDPNKLAPPYHEFLNYIHPDDRDYVDSALALKKAVKGKTHSIGYRIVLANGKERAVHMQSEVVFDEKNTPIRTKGIIQDITERKEAEEALKNLEIVRKKEIHHRIKNNLQVISSLLDLQADKFDNPKVIEAFRESQDRVISMALIHEELYKGGGNDTLDFSTYAKELAENLFQTYILNSKNIHLNTDLEENAFFDMDTAVPLGIIVNELVSNSLKHAFPGRDEGEIQIKLHREENGEDNKSATFVLTVSDNGVGIPENLEIEDLGSLGLQLITTLVDQLDGELELKRKNGTEFTMRFTVKKDNLGQVDLK
jgi:PAS domain S-box-containing protein